MSRDFEQEFRQLKLNEVPDLWDRIEAGLSERQTLPSASGDMTAAIKQYRSSGKPAWRRWGTLAAACICVAIILPALSIVIGSLGGKKNSYSDKAMSSGSPAADETNMTHVSESAEAAAEEYDTVAAAEEYDVAGTAGDEGMAAASNGYAYTQDSYAKTDSMDTILDDSRLMADAQLSEEEKEADDSSRTAEKGEILEDIIVEITESSSSGNDIIYKALVKRADKGGVLQKDMYISLLCNSETDYDFTGGSESGGMLEVSRSYVISVKYVTEPESGVDNGTAKLMEESGFIVMTVEKE